MSKLQLQKKCILVAIYTSIVQSTAIAQDVLAYPTRPIQLIVPFTAGASTDLIARFVAPKLSEALGQPVVVENRPGAGGIIGATYVVRAKPDGYTLLVASSFVIHGPLLQKVPSFDPAKDFTPIAPAFQYPFLLVTSATLPVENVAGLVNYGKANPGNLIAASLGGFSDVISAMFRKAAGLDLQIVPYRGAPEATMGVIRGDAQLVFNPYASMQPQINSGQVRMMAVTGPQRSATIPNVPTFGESGIPGLDILSVVGILGPPRMPQPVVARLNRELVKILKTDDGRTFITTRGNDIVDDASAEHFGLLLQQANEKFQYEIEEFGIEKH
jgi:tripartite-type tricarboxylate transporter receptor subunit TctC